MIHRFRFLPVCLISATLALLATAPLVHSDEIKLKNGESLSGRITYEADDIVKIEIQVTDSIKETKVISRADVLEIVKESPDSVAFKEIQDLVPTPSLMPASAYQSAIRQGPEAFLRSFPDSEFAPEVKKIQKTLDEELDKVERGFIQLEGEWISPQDQAEFEALTQSRIHLLNMKQAASSRNYNGFINAMRQFQAIEDKYYGTPALPEAVELARNIIPRLGQQLQNMVRDVEYRNQQYEKTLAAMDEVARAQVEQARASEVEAYQAGVEADKKKGIKWVRLDPRSKPAIQSYLDLASNELTRIHEYEVEALERQAELLVEADRLAADGKLTQARAKLEAGAEITGRKVRSRSSRKKSSGSYLAAISGKISALEEEEEAKAKARAEALESEALTAKMKAAEKEKDETEEGKSEEEDSPDESSGKSEDNESVGAEEEEKMEEEKPRDAFSALASGKNQEKDEAPGSSEKSEKKDGEEEEEERDAPPRAVAEDTGGGFPIVRVIQIGTVLLLVAVVLLKVLGVGGKKDE